MSSALAERTVAANGARLWTLRHGAGPPLVFLHGGPGLWDSFDEPAALLDDIVEVHRYDQRGGGRSERVPPYDIDTFIADLEALRAHWGHGRWIVAGHSWGAALALVYAVAHPERVAAILYISGTGIDEDWKDEYRANCAARVSPGELARYGELRALLKGAGALPEGLDREYCVLSWMPDYPNRARALALAAKLYRPPGPNYDVNAVLNAEWSRLCADASFREGVAHIEAPALLVHGSEDPRPVSAAVRLAALLPRAELSVIEGAGHLPWVEQPARFAKTVRAFLGGLSRP
jgi:proline iminopeptidase